MYSKVNNNFSIIRLSAAYFVLAGHMYALLNNAPPMFLFNSVQRLGIIIFFIIGGYLITKSWMRDTNYIRYLIKRVLRIVPPLVVFVLLAACVVGPIISSLSIKEYFNHISFKLYFKNIIFSPHYSLPGVFEQNLYPNAVNGSLWSLPVEMFMYLIIPIIYELGKKKKGLIHFIITVFICALSVYQLAYYPEWRLVVWGTDIAQALSIMPFYFIGSFFATIELKPNYLNLQIAIIIVFVFSGIIIRSSILNHTLSLILIPYVIFSLAFSKPIFTNNKLVNKIEVSYGLYLFGFFVQQLVINFYVVNSIRLSFNIIFILSLTLTYLIALLCKEFVEKPFQRISAVILNKIHN